jgi:quinolinate synthase
MTQLKDLPLVSAHPTNSTRQPIPNWYLHLSEQELDQRIRAAREALGSKLIILGHHYQRTDIIMYADVRGDSYKLAKYAAENPQADYIVFCGVNFMGETAAILCDPRQTVIHPNLDAGCHMADMAPTQDVLDCWDDITSIISPDRVMPITYMNSSADIKALVGKHGGVVSTSSNNHKVFLWARARREKILFFPDQYLGMNTWKKLGLDTSKVVKWNPYLELGGNTPEQLEKAELILWAGFCSVHKRFTVDQITKGREMYPGIKIVVHPECTEAVVEAADYVGSTEYIIDKVTNSPAGSVWGVGTEINLVSRLQDENPDKTVFCLDPVVCPCSMMYRIHPAYLLWVLDGLVEGKVYNKVVVDPITARDAKLGLDRMLQVI